jgi:Fe2+ transport system protein FeoA
VTLSTLRKGQKGRVLGIATADADLAVKLREIGFSEGDEVEMITSGPFGQPLAVRLNRTMVALRANEAAAVQISHD